MILLMGWIITTSQTNQQPPQPWEYRFNWKVPWRYLLGHQPGLLGPQHQIPSWLVIKWQWVHKGRAVPDLAAIPWWDTSKWKVLINNSRRFWVAIICVVHWAPRQTSYSAIVKAFDHQRPACLPYANQPTNQSKWLGCSLIHGPPQHSLDSWKPVYHASSTCVCRSSTTWQLRRTCRGSNLNMCSHCFQSWAYPKNDYSNRLLNGTTLAGAI